MQQAFVDFLLSFGIESSVIFEVAVYAPFLLMLLAVFAFAVSMQRQSREDRKAKMVRQILAAGRARRPGMTAEEIAKRLAPRLNDPKSRAAYIVFFEALLRLVNFNRAETEKKLIQSGDRDPRAISRYILQRGLGMILAPMFLYILAPTLGLDGVLAIPVILMGVLAGGILIDVRLDKALAERRSRVLVEMPVLLDLLTVYLEAGQPFDASLIRASRALEKSFPVVAEEAAYLNRDLDMTVERERVMREFGERLNTITARTFVNIILQSEKRGSAVTPALRTLAREARKEVITDIERKAQKLPTVMQLPMFMFILPAIFASVIGPAVIQVMLLLASGVNL